VRDTLDDWIRKDAVLPGTFSVWQLVVIVRVAS
jgi:hypothetical protein